MLLFELWWAMVGNIAKNRFIPRDLNDILSLYRQYRKLLIKRINNGRSLRYLGDKFRFSHHTIKTITGDENYIPSKKVMIKIIQGIKKPMTQKTWPQKYADAATINVNDEILNSLVITIRGDIISTKNHTMIAKNKYSRKRFVMKNKIAKNQERSLQWQLVEQKKIWKSMIGGISFPYRIQFKCYRSTFGRFDYINIIQGLTDAMVKVGYLPDDDANHIVPIFEQYEIDKKNPRTDFRIMR